jgi:hypothetical protein
LQVAFAAAALSNGGIIPAPRLALSFRSPEGDWAILPPVTTEQAIMTPEKANTTVTGYQNPENPGSWEIVFSPSGEDLTWYLAGTSPSAGLGIPLSLVLVLEEQNQELAVGIGRTVLETAIGQ